MMKKKNKKMKKGFQHCYEFFMLSLWTINALNVIVLFMRTRFKHGTINHMKFLVCEFFYLFHVFIFDDVN